MSSSDLGLASNNHTHNTWTDVSSQLGSLTSGTHKLYVNESIKLANYTYNVSLSSQTEGITTNLGVNVIPSNYAPLHHVAKISNLNYGTITVFNGNYEDYPYSVWYTVNRTRSSLSNIYVNMYWRY